MSRVAIVTDSASDLSVEAAAAAGITVVPLLVRFGTDEFRTGVDITLPDFYRRLTAPGAPFPTTAACSPGDFQAVFSRLLAEGAEGIVCLTVGSELSATHAAARVARDLLPGAPIEVADSHTASMALGLLALVAAEAAAAGASVAEIVAEVERRRPDAIVYVALETLEYLRRGGRISAAQAAIGSVLSVKPIVTVAGGHVITADKPRTASRARARILDLLTARPVERIAVLHAQAPGARDFAVELSERTGILRSAISVGLIGPSVGPHVGPGAYGAAVLLRGG